MNKVIITIIFFVNLFYYIYEDIILYNLGKLREQKKNIFDNIFTLLIFPSFEGLIHILTVATIMSSLSTFTIYLIEKIALNYSK